jgi:DNA-binding NtrC family response regulator
MSPAPRLARELFGQEKGAATGAKRAKPGLLALADGGTLFLDEVGALPPPIQAKLLRTLEGRKVRRVGARAPRSPDVLLIAATRRDLRAEIARGTFLEDLYVRLSGAVFPIPSLRARQAEIAPLAERFLVEASSRLERTSPPQFLPETLSQLQQYEWPGNVGELRDVVERASLLAAGDFLLPADLAAHVVAAAVRTRA